MGETVPKHVMFGGTRFPYWLSCLRWQGDQMPCIAAWMEEGISVGVTFLSTLNGKWNAFSETFWSALRKEAETLSLPSVFGNSIN